MIYKPQISLRVNNHFTHPGELEFLFQKSPTPGNLAIFLSIDKILFPADLPPESFCPTLDNNQSILFLGLKSILARANLESRQPKHFLNRITKLDTSGTTIHITGTGSSMIPPRS